MKITAAVATDKGRIRVHNEDCWFLNGKVMGDNGLHEHVTESEEFDGQTALYAVCDGMGGAQGGEVASRITSVGLTDAINETEDRLQERVRTINQSVFDELAGKGGTTISGIQLNGHQYRTLNIGDSRTYLLRDGTLTQLTRDHSEVQLLLDLGAITPEQAKNYKRRNVITRCVGSDPAEDNVMADISEWKDLRVDDCFMIVSDGVCGSLSEEEMTEILVQNSVADGAEKLTVQAVSAGSKDNVTAIVIRITEVEVPTASREPSAREIKDIPTVRSGKPAQDKAERILLIAIAVLCIAALCIMYIRHRDTVAFLERIAK